MKERTNKSQSDEPRSRPGSAAGRIPRPSTAAAFVDVRPGAVANRQLADAVQRSPYVAAQRTQLESAFGAAARLPDGAAADSTLQGKREPMARQSAGRADLPRMSGAPIIQRYIKVKDDKDSYSAFSWAMKYEAKRGKKYELARLRQALERIDASAEKTDFYENADALFDRVAELVEAGKERAVQPVWREPSPSKVMMELEYYFDELKQPPQMELNKTYQSNWDTNGGFGGEYETVNEGAQKWVIHVHRGANGGIKSAKVKSWATRGVGHNGSTLFKFENLAKIGVPTVDTRQML